MTDQLSPELETRLQAWLTQRAPVDVPAALLDRVVAIPRAPQAFQALPTARRVAGPVPGARRRMRPMFALAAVLMLTGAVVAGALLVAASRRNSVVPVPSASPAESVAPTPTPTPTPTPEPTPRVPTSGILPETIPDAVEHGSIDTPIGAARWVHVQGNKTTLPNPFAPIQMPDGRLAWFQRGGPGAACLNDPASTDCTDPPTPALQVSDDVLAPRDPRTLPIEVAEADLRLIGDTFWFTTSDPVTIWRSDDLEDWQRTDTSAFVSPGPTSLDWTTSVSLADAIGDTTFAAVTYTAKDPGSLLGHPGVNVHLATTDSGGYLAMQHRPRSQGGDVELGPITIDVTADGVRFLDAGGLEVGRVDGVGREFVDEWLRRNQIQYDQLVTADGNSWSIVELPGAPLADWPMLVPLDDATLIFVPEAAGVRSWRTTDGKTWTGGDLLVDAGGKTLAAYSVNYREEAGRTIVVAYGTDGTSYWRSADGATWVPAPEEPTQTPATKFEGGWLRTADQAGTWQASRDGTTFEAVPALANVIDKITPLGAGGSNEFAIGNTVFFIVEEDEAPYTRDVWMIEFEAPTP